MLSSDEKTYNSQINYTPLRIFELKRTYKKKAFQHTMLLASVFAVLAIVAGFVFIANPREKLEYVQAASYGEVSPVISPSISSVPSIISKP